MAKIKLNMIVGVFVIVLIFLQYRLWVSPDGIQDLLRFKRALAAQTIENENLKKRNQDLLFQIERIQNSHHETEARARNGLGMIKKGETFYQIIRQND